MGRCGTPAPETPGAGRPPIPLSSASKERADYLWAPAGRRLRVLLASRRLHETLAGLQDKIARDPLLGWAHALSAEVKRDPRVSRFGETEEDLERASALSPRSYWIWGLKGKAFAQAGMLAKARAALEKAASLSDSCPWIRVELSFVRLGMGAPEKALNDALAALASSPKSYEAHCAHAACLCALKRWEPALRVLQRLEKLKPERPGSIPLPGAARPSPAELEFTALKALGRGHGAWPYFWKGEAELKRARLEAAEKNFSAALDLDMTHAWSWAWRGWSRLQRGDIAGALSDIRAALRLDFSPADAGRLMALQGHALRLLKKLPEADSSFRQAIRTRPADPVPRLNRAEVLMALGRPLDAERELRFALEADSDYIPAYMVRSGLRLRRRDREGSLSDARRVLAAAGSESVKTVLARILEGKPLCADVPLLDSPRQFSPAPAERPAPLQPVLKAVSATGRAMVDPGIELIGFLKLFSELKSGAPLTPDFCARDNGVAGALKEALKSFSRFVEPRLLAELDAAARRNGNPDFPWLGMTQMMMGLTEPPEFRIITPAWRRGEDLRLLGLLRRFARRSRFRDFFNARRGFFSSWIKRHRDIVENEAYAKTVSDYTGLDCAGYYDVVVSLFLRGVSLRAILHTYDGALGARTVYCPLTSAEDYKRLLLSPSRSELLWTGWHELLHLPLDAETARLGAEVSELSPVYCRVEPSARRKDWPDCLSEHLVRAATIRILHGRLGAKAAAELLAQDMKAGYRALPPLLRGLRQYERNRARYPTLLDFFPRWLAYWPLTEGSDGE